MIIGKLFNKLLDTNAREVDRLRKLVEKINSLEPGVKKLKQTDFAKKTKELKARFEKGESLKDLMPESFALVREATKRTLGMRLYDEQLMAAIALFEGQVAEQKTGEGKTLSAVPALYLRALTGKGVHLVTVNDYLARRDAGWNGPIFELLGMTIGAIVQEMKSYIYDANFYDSSHGDERLAHLKQVERRQAYEADITYGTNNEFGFDYLRDNMVMSLAEMSQRGHYFAIVDEVDSILIDEARTPLIISAPDTDPTDKYYKFADIVKKLNPDTDYSVDEKLKSATLTETGITRVEKILGVNNLYEKDFEAIHHIENALRAKTLYLLDRDYVIKDDQVIIVDEFTGRLMIGRRWSDGLHQAVEAKEGVVIQQESKTLATISFQNYFRMYEVLSGMTGTAATEAEEFAKIYKLEVVVIPTHKPMGRIDSADAIFKTLRGKYGAVVNEIDQRSSHGQPILVGTTSIEKNEIVSEYLKRKKVTHNVLNAKNHEKEAMILADAGKPAAVTVATNMAGRGVDIILGGSMPDRREGQTEEDYKKTKDYKKWQENHAKVIAAGGLHVIGTERHESRRIDNQLRGRSGRQGDPGSSKFYLSLEDDLMRIFGGEQISGLMDKLKLPEDQPIENRLISRAIEQAQVKVEGFHFDARKRVVEYDDISNQQRDIIYKLRKRILEEKNIKQEILEKLNQQIVDVDPEILTGAVMDIIPFDNASTKGLKKEIAKLKDAYKVREFLQTTIEGIYGAREKQVGESVMRDIEKFAYLGSIDHMWIDHLDNIENLREGVGIRGNNDNERIVIFKTEAYDMFENLIDKIDEELARRIFRIGIQQAMQSEIPLDMAASNVDTKDSMGLAEQNTPPKQKINKTKIGRNDPCWCGKKNSEGKPIKWKNCHYPQLSS